MLNGTLLRGIENFIALRIVTHLRVTVNLLHKRIDFRTISILVNYFLMEIVDQPQDPQSIELEHEITDIITTFFQITAGIVIIQKYGAPTLSG